WEVGAARPRERVTLKGHLSVASGLAFAPDVPLLASGSYDKTIRLWDVGAAAPKEKPPLKEDASIGAVAFGPDGKHLAVMPSGSIARVWRIDSRRKLRAFQGHEHNLSGLAYSADGKTVLTGSLDSTLRLWDAATGKELQQFKGHEKYVNNIALSPDGKRAL